MANSHSAGLRGDPHGQASARRRRPNPAAAAKYLLLLAFAVIVGLFGASRDATALGVVIDTSAFNPGDPAQLDFSFYDGDGTDSNIVTVTNLATDGALGATTCAIGCSGGPPFALDESVGFGQFLQDFLFGTYISFDLSYTTNFSGTGVPDLVVVNLLDPGTGFTLVSTNLDALDAPIPYQDALFLLSLAGAGEFQTPTQTDPTTGLTVVPEPAASFLVALGLGLLAYAQSNVRRRTRPNRA